MTNSNRQRLEAAIARRDRAAQTVQRLQGKLAAARETVAKIEAECHERGVPPEKLDKAISQLQARYDKALADFEKSLSEVEGQLAPFV